MIKISMQDSFKCIYKFESESEKQLVANYLTIEFKESVFKFDFKTKRRAWVNQEVKYLLYSENIKKNIPFTTTKTMSKLVVKYLESLNIEVETDYFNPPKIKLIDKWKKIFENNPNMNNGKLQLTASNLLLDDNTGIASLFTGVGKGEILLSCVESYYEQFKGNIVIIVFNNSLCQEIELRAKKYNIYFGNRIKIINPVGYYRSNYSDTQEAKDWLKNVDCIIADEAHHFSKLDGGWARLVYEANPNYVYGFSATSDISEGEDLTFESLLKTKSYQVASLLSICGEIKINVDLPIPLKVTNLKINLINKNIYEEFKKLNPDSMQQLVSLTLKHNDLPSIIKYIIKNIIPEDSICFIPIITCIEDGEILANALNRINIPTVFYSASVICTPVGNLNNITLSDLKDLARDKHFKILISNSVGIEGIDIPNLSSIIPLTGNSYKGIIQSIGRSARTNLIHCIFIYDKNNHLLNRQMKNKYEIVKSRLNIINEINIKL